jgi:hypothetical protein
MAEFAKPRVIPSHISAPVLESNTVVDIQQFSGGYGGEIGRGRGSECV